MTNHLPRRALLGALLAGIPLSAQSQSIMELGKSFLNSQNRKTGGGSGLGAGLSPAQIGGGLKEALQIASRHVVGQLGRVDGFNGDPLIRIALPGPLQQVAGILRALSQAGLMDDLQTKMNRAAEQAVPKALDIFTGAITRMTIADAQGILMGPNDGATQYFRRTTSNELTSSFSPIVDKSLSSVGAVKALQYAQTRTASLPVGGDMIKNFNLTNYVVGKSLDGVFHYLATEEADIRANPAARTTDLLRKVFG